MKYQVGQKVKIVRCVTGAARQLIGRETVVSEALKSGQYKLAIDVELPLYWQLVGAWLPEELEPLNPPKQQETITWDEACFDKSGKWVREGVAA